MSLGEFMIFLVFLSMSGVFIVKLISLKLKEWTAIYKDAMTLRSINPRLAEHYAGINYRLYRESLSELESLQDELSKVKSDLESEKKKNSKLASELKKERANKKAAQRAYDLEAAKH